MHVNNCVKRDNPGLNLIKRTISLDVGYKVKKLCYMSFIRPLVEYCTILWNPINKKHILQVESVQRRANKYILCDCNSDYRERHINCDLLPLIMRREIMHVTFLYNSVENLNAFDYNSIVYFNDISLRRGKN